MEKYIPFWLDDVRRISSTFKTPFYLYSEDIIRNAAKDLNKAFSWLWDWNFKNYFAVKACSNPHILKILKSEWFWADCSSIAELIMSEKVWLIGENIMFTSNNTTLEEFELAKKLGAIINLDDITHIDKLFSLWVPEIVSCRYNPGSLKEWNDIIGNPVEAKYWMTRQQILELYKIMAERWVKRFGLHTMVVSNMLDEDYMIDTANMLFDLMKDIKNYAGINFKFVNLGGWIWIPYKPNQEKVNLQKIWDAIKELYYEKVISEGLGNVKIFMENGRVITWPAGFLVTKVINKASKYREYIWVDASMSNLMRPAIYGAYHHISVLWKESLSNDQVYDVTWSLCENNDKFAVQRDLPNIEIWDFLAIHDAWAHWYAMWFQYNGKLRCSELLLKSDWDVKLIRRAETIDDYLSTLDFTDI